MRTSSFSAISKALFLFLFVVAALLAQPAATVQWDVRTTGSDNNGGGFDPASAGTDQSQGAAAVTIDNSTVKATVAASTITFTAAYTPSSADVGNIVNIISSTGGTPPTFKRYQISSETLTTWVLNQTTGAAGATITSAIMGGSLLTVAKGFSVEVNKNTVWLKAGTYTLTTGLTAPSGYSGLVGYQTTHGDNGTAPLITTATNSLTMLTLAGAALLLSNVSMSNTAVTRGVGISNPGAYPDYPELRAEWILERDFGFERGRGNGCKCQNHGLYRGRVAASCGGCSDVLFRMCDHKQHRGGVFGCGWQRDESGDGELHHFRERGRGYPVLCQHGFHGSRKF